MSRKIRFCGTCSTYTMDQTCKVCLEETMQAGPQRFSPEDRFGKYRRMAKKQQLEE